MLRSFGLPRLAVGLVLVPLSAALGAACGGSDVVDTFDASSDGASPDASARDGSLVDARGQDAARVDSAGTDATFDVGSAPDSASDARSDAAIDAASQDASRDAPPDSEGGIVITPPPSLGTGSPFVVLGAATVTNSGVATMLIGDVGTTGPSITGLTGPPFQPSGKTEINNARASQALLDVGTAYTSLAGMACPPANDLTGKDLGGMTLAPGVYCFSSSAGQLGSTVLTFDAKGDPNAVWVIQVGTQLTVMDNASAVIIGGLPSLGCRVFFTTGTAAVLNGGVHYLGNFLASSQTSLLTDATLSPGRAFGLTSGVTLLSNTITAAACP